ncbi:MAG: aminomethyl-transferring glycine dehydrogenase subunit GcvPA [Endomicrobiales bacterium]|nr:aminomethyl-transferring glycine dehydrogenase subunit GcvPA [Endomicrobiales bacterium]
MNYIPVTEKEKQEMLGVIGVDSVEALFDIIPQKAQIKRLNLPEGLDEHTLFKKLSDLSSKNTSIKNYVSYKGAGIYEHFIPSVVSEVIGRSEFYTAYTPYQPEASQGTLQAIFEYQSMLCALTSMDVANASLYDGASACAEACLLAARLSGKNKIIYSSGVHPHYIAVTKTYLEGSSIKLIEVPMENGLTNLSALSNLINEETAGILIQSPNFFGIIEDLQTIKEKIKDKALFIVAANPIALGVLQSPGECGADICVGEGQVLGNPTSFGGSLFGFMSAKSAYTWKLPGRFVGKTHDTNGRVGFVLTLQSREQHIRREKAASNICTNSALNALAACAYLAALGPQGLKEIGEANIAKSHYAFNKITALNGFEALYKDVPFFNEFAITTTKNIANIQKALFENKILGPVEVAHFDGNKKDVLLFCVTELRTKEEIDKLVNILEAVK